MIVLIIFYTLVLKTATVVSISTENSSESSVAYFNLYLSSDNLSYPGKNEHFTSALCCNFCF